MNAKALVEHFFRHEYGRLVAILSCRLGVEHLTEIEDAVQSALMSALEHWTISGVPDNPSAWLYRVSNNKLLGELRLLSRRKRLRERLAEESQYSIAEEFVRDDEVEHDLLHMLFICCDEDIPVESQLVFALKTLCGFDVREIALRLFTSEANVYQRFSRAKSQLAKNHPRIDKFDNQRLRQRLESVQNIVYVLFTEGHLSSHLDRPLREEVCDEAIRLTRILAKQSVGKSPTTSALLALMLLHRARMPSRKDGDGHLLLLEEQDRSYWDEQLIGEGISWLANAAQGETLSRYHIEAAISAEHCLASNFAETRWEKIASNYGLLERITNSPIHTLNRAVAVAEWKSPADALEILTAFEPPSWLAGSYQWSAVMSDIYRRTGNVTEALRYRELAIDSAPTQAIKDLIGRRLN